MTKFVMTLDQALKDSGYSDPKITQLLDAWRSMLEILDQLGDTLHAEEKCIFKHTITDSCACLDVWQLLEDANRNLVEIKYSLRQEVEREYALCLGDQNAAQEQDDY